jgi:hypothetical protein
MGSMEQKFLRAFQIMNKKILLVACFLSLPCFALEVGECIALESSKKYIQVDFQEPFPKDVSFSCEYICLGPNNYENLIRGTSKVRIHNIGEEARLTVCQGIKVVRAPWGYDFGGKDAFYAYDTSISEIKSWAVKNISRNNNFERKLLMNLKVVLEEVGRSYLNVARPDYEYFESAGNRLLAMAAKLPEDPSVLDSELQVIEKNNGIPETNMMTSNGLVESIIRFQASWRLKSIF